ncbi:MAG: hypothetical protein ACKOQS_05825 [Dolichospermum sp.]
MTNKLATFRIDDELWQQFQDIAKQNNTTASALLVGFVQGVVKTECIDTAVQSSIPDIDAAVQPSIQNLDELIDNKIKLSIQDGDINHKFEELEQRLKKLSA